MNRKWYEIIYENNILLVIVYNKLDLIIYLSYYKYKKRYYSPLNLSDPTKHMKYIQIQMKKKVLYAKNMFIVYENINLMQI